MDEPSRRTMIRRRRWHPATAIATDMKLSRRPPWEPADDDAAGGDDALTREQWVDRFALRLAMLDDMQHPLDLLLEVGNELWPGYGGVEPEVIADAEYRAGLRR